MPAQKPSKKETPISNTALGEITAHARRQLQLAEQIAKVQAELTELMKQYRQIEREDLPEAMNEVGVQKLVLEDGALIEIKHDVAYGIPEPRRQEAYQWLEEKGYGGLIKTEVSIAFSKGELMKAQKLVTQLAKKGLPVELARSVNYQTLGAWLREQYAQPKPPRIPQALFGQHPFSKANIKLPKTK